jgi:tellurite resistance-related uncharacterized protein
MNQFYPKTPVYDEKAVEQALLDKELSVEDIKPCLDVKKGKVFLRRIKSENE